MASVEIQGINCIYRDIQPGETILYENLPADEQVFTREQHPFTDDELIAIASKELLPEQYTETQRRWVDREKKRFDDGLYAYIGGVLRFIPGAYWAYINYWTLEHGEKPDYREDDRIFFLFHEYLRLNTKCKGLTRGKGRRQGATSIGMFFMWFVAGRKEHQLCGTTSFTDGAAQDNFQRMFMYGFKALLPCFQADFDSDSENFIRFVKPVEKKKKGVLAVKREGLNSYVDYKSNVINSYDSGRQSYNCPDEGGKRNKLNINSYWSRLSKTLEIGTNKVGFAYLPTTVGAKAEGGENYKIFWDNSNQYKKGADGNPVGLNTDNEVVKYFAPASRGFAGCIDKFGNSVEDDPLEPVMGNDGKWITEGAKTIILRERAKKSGEQLMEHKRDYPLDEFDMFSFAIGNCEFSSENIQKQIRELEENPVFLRKVRLNKLKKVIKSTVPNKKDTEQFYVNWMDDDNSGWLVYEFPNKENHFKVVNGFYEALNKSMYQIGVDTIKDEFSMNGSRPTICVFKKTVLIDGTEMGMYPVAFYDDKTRLDVHFDEEVLKACLYYGCTVNYEVDARTDFYRFFHKNGARALLEWTPKFAQDPVKFKPAKYKPGTQSADPFQLAAQLQAAKMYIDGTDPETYNGHVHRIVFPKLLDQLLSYNHSERTPYDMVISLMMAILPVLGEAEKPVIPHRERSILPKYTVKISA